MSCSYWWSWRHWRSRCLAMGGSSPWCPSLHPPPPPHRCQHTGPTCHHSRSGCWRWSWHSGCGREGSLQRRLTTHICTLLTISLSSSIVLVFTQSSINTPAPSILLMDFVFGSFTDFDRKAWRQAQSDEVAQLSKQGIGDGHKVNDGGHLFCQGEGMGLTQPEFGFKPGNTCCSQTLQYIACYIFSGSIINTIRGCETSNTLHILSYNKELEVEKRFKMTKRHKFRQHGWTVWVW